jgi:hypothetical protein
MYSQTNTSFLQIPTSVSVVWEDATPRDGAEGRLAIYNIDDGSTAEVPGIKGPFTATDDGRIIVGKEIFSKPIFDNTGRIQWAIVCRRFPLPAARSPGTIIIRRYNLTIEKHPIFSYCNLPFSGLTSCRGATGCCSGSRDVSG